jgi:hypothetical protein
MQPAKRLQTVTHSHLTDGGNDVGLVDDVATTTDCCALCGANAYCQFWTLDQSGRFNAIGRCLLKSSSQGQRGLSRHVSGARQTNVPPTPTPTSYPTTAEPTVSPTSHPPLTCATRSCTDVILSRRTARRWGVATLACADRATCQRPQVRTNASRRHHRRKIQPHTRRLRSRHFLPQAIQPRTCATRSCTVVTLPRRTARRQGPATRACADRVSCQRQQVRTNASRHRLRLRAPPLIQRARSLPACQQAPPLYPCPTVHHQLVVLARPQCILCLLLLPSVLSLSVRCFSSCTSTARATMSLQRRRAVLRFPTQSTRARPLIPSRATCRLMRRCDTFE